MAKCFRKKITPVVEDATINIFKELKKSHQNKFLQEPLSKNHNYINLKFWLGEERAKNLIEKLKKQM